MGKNICFLYLKKDKVNLLPIILVFFMLLFIGIVSVNSGKKYIVYNYTNSIPKGFYYLYNDVDISSIKKGDLIVFGIPLDVKGIVIERNWLNENDTLTKPVTAIYGDFVCTDDGMVRVNNISYKNIEKYDSNGRNMPKYEYCDLVKEGDIFVFIKNSKSFDSRYYGPINISEVIAKAKPLWIF